MVRIGEKQKGVFGLKRAKVEGAKTEFDGKQFGIGFPVTVFVGWFVGGLNAATVGI